MLSTKHIMIWGGKCLIIYFLLLLAGKKMMLNEMYGDCIRAFGNTVYSEKVVFERKSDLIFDTKVIIFNMKVKYKANRVISLWYMGYLPTILCVSLILALPFPDWKQQVWALLGGTTLYNLILFTTLHVKILSNSMRLMLEYSSTNNVLFYQVIKPINKTLEENVTIYTIIPVLIWLLVSFRKSDWEKFVARTGKK